MNLFKIPPYLYICLKKRKRLGGVSSSVEIRISKSIILFLPYLCLCISLPKTLILHLERKSQI